MMKKDIIITLNSKTGRVNLPSTRLGINGENLQGNIILKFEDEFVDGTAILELERNGEKEYITMTKGDEIYSLPVLSSLLTEVTVINMQVRITVGTGSDIPVWKSNIFYLKVDEAINATTTIPEEYAEWIDIANEKLNEIDNFDIDVSKTGTVATVTITKKDGTTESVEINDGADGQDGYTPQKGIDYFTEQDIEEMETDVKEDVLDEVYTKSETDTLLQEKADVEDIPDVSSFITKDVNNLTNYTLKTSTGSLIDLEINQTTYVVTLSLKDQDGNVISTDTIDLPLENVVVSGSYDETNKKIVLTLQSGDTVDIPVGALISGLQSEITSSNKLASDLVDDSNSGNKFVTTSEKTTWNGKYTKPSGGIPKTDLASEVQTSLGKADTALQSSDLTNYVTNTDYASSSTAGVIKVTNANAAGVSSIGTIYPSVLSYLQYTSGGDWMFIGKGTLENVITGKGLIDSSSDITGNASTSTTLKSFNYSRKGTNNTWAKVATASLVGTWEEKHAYLFVKGTHNSNFKQNGIISIDVLGNATKSKVNSYSAQFISASTDLNVENFYIEYQDGDANTNATINFWVRNTTNAYASWQFKILQNTGWTIESANTSVTTLPTQDFTGKISELNNKTLNDKDGNDITTTYVKNTEIDRIKATLPTTTGSGEEVTLEKTIELDFVKPPLPRGNSEQEGEPSPDNEVPITNVTGNVKVTISNNDNSESKTLPVSLGNIELCKIGNYQDYLYKNNGKWYKHNAINKLVLNGSENWSISNNVFYLASISDYINSSGKICLSDKYTAINNTDIGTSAITQNNSICFFITNTNPRLYIRDERFNNVNAFKAELSENNVKVYYPTVTPTDTEITDATLISQLEAISKTLSYQGQTNITSNTIAMFDVEAYQSTKLISEDLDLTKLSTFDSTKTQVLKNINGTLTWVNE